MRLKKQEPTDDQYRERLAQALTELADIQLELEQERHRRAETQALFDLVLGAMSDAVVLVDARGRISQANDAVVDLTGRPAGDLVGRTVAELFQEGFPATAWDVLKRAPEGRLPALEALVRSPHRGPVPVSVSCSVLRNGTGKVVGAVYAARDLSETQRLVHQLEEAEARWRLLAELGDLLSSEVDPRKSLADVCRWLAQPVGAGMAIVVAGDLTVEHAAAWPPGELASQLETLVGSPLDRASALARALRDRRVIHAPSLAPSFPLVGSEGAPKDVRSAAIVPLVARDSGLGALLAFAPEPEEVSERVLSVVEVVAGRIALALANAHLWEEISRLRAAEDAARFREELLAGVSHDMQTPLAIVLGSLLALRDEETMDPARRTVVYERMARQASTLHRLVQQFLDYSRVEAGRPLTLRPRPTDVGDAISRLHADMGSRWRLEVDLPDDLPSAFVDPDRLDQVLANLVSNALKFSPPSSGISIAARATDDTVEITVTDRGQGMSPADLAIAFEKFRRGAGAANFPGTGLGLYMSRVLVEAQGGRITAASRLGEGSQLTVVLPRRPVAEDGS